MHPFRGAAAIALLYLHVSAIDPSGVPLSPYGKPVHPMTSVYVFDSTPLSMPEKLLLDSLAGYLARERALLYRVNGNDWRSADQAKADSYTRWLQDMSKDGLDVMDDVFNASAAQILQVAMSAAGLSPANVMYVRCDIADLMSVSTAVTLAAGSDALLLIAEDAAIEAMLVEMHVTQYADTRGKTVANAFDGWSGVPGVFDKLSRRVYLFECVALLPGADIAIYYRAATLMWVDSEDGIATRTRLLKSRDIKKDGIGVAFGWGPENAYLSELNPYGVIVYASDVCTNFAALAGWVAPPSEIPAAFPAIGKPAKSKSNTAKHTVSFVMSDGDNLQWMYNNFSLDNRWFGALNRGKFPLGWTISPALPMVAPAIVKDFVGSLTPNDELVAGPSGAAYVFPTKLASAIADDFAELTAQETTQIRTLRVWNVLGQDDEEPLASDLSPMLTAQQGKANDGMIYYGFGDGYASMHGKLYWFAGKPVVTGRYSLWGEESQGDLVGVKTMIQYLKKLSKDPTRPEGYSVIPVHAWSHGYDDILAIVEALEADGGFDIVLPSEMLRRVKAHLSGLTPDELAGVTCSCDVHRRFHRRAGYTCSDGTRGTCSKKCVAPALFVKGDEARGCSGGVTLFV